MTHFSPVQNSVLTTHCQPFPAVPLSPSLYLQKSERRLALSYSPVDRRYLSLTCYSTKHYPQKSPFQPIYAFLTIIYTSTPLPVSTLVSSCVPGHLQVEFRWNCVLMKTNLALFVALAAHIWTNQRGEAGDRWRQKKGDKDILKSSGSHFLISESLTLWVHVCVCVSMPVSV